MFDVASLFAMLKKRTGGLGVELLNRGRFLFHAWIHYESMLECGLTWVQKTERLCEQ